MPSLESAFFRMMLVGQKYRAAYLLPIAYQRFEMEWTARWARLPGGIAITPTIAAGRPAEWIGPVEAVPERAILYLHGGAYIMGSCDTHRALIARIARAAGIRAISIEYRLAPEHPYPAALDDALAAYRWLREAGYPPQSIALAGDSAGAGLAVAVLLSLREAGEPLPAAAALLSPWADLAGEGESIRSRADLDPWLTPPAIAVARHYYADHDPRTPLISPVYADLRGLPPLLLQVGDHEILLSDSTRLAERAQAAGVQVQFTIWDSMWHGWHFFAPSMPEANQAIDEVGGFLRGRLIE